MDLLVGIYPDYTIWKKFNPIAKKINYPVGLWKRFQNIQMSFDFLFFVKFCHFSCHMTFVLFIGFVAVIKAMQCFRCCWDWISRLLVLKMLLYRLWSAKLYTLEPGDISLIYFFSSRNCYLPMWWQWWWLQSENLSYHRHYHIEAETKWPTFSRRHFQMHFLVWKFINLD